MQYIFFSEDQKNGLDCFHCTFGFSQVGQVFVHHGHLYGSIRGRLVNDWLNFGGGVLRVCESIVHSIELDVHVFNIGMEDCKVLCSVVKFRIGNQVHQFDAVVHLSNSDGCIVGVHVLNWVSSDVEMLSLRKI